MNVLVLPNLRVSKLLQCMLNRRPATLNRRSNLLDCRKAGATATKPNDRASACTCNNVALVNPPVLPMFNDAPEVSKTVLPSHEYWPHHVAGCFDENR